MLLTKEFFKDFTEQVSYSCLIEMNGGPFGAIVFKGNEIVGRGFNCVISHNDPTAHAEIMAIRDACKTLNTHDLTGYELYATGYPCPMCMSAIIWANIKKVYYSADYNDANELGFRDDYIFKFIKNKCKNTKTLELEQVDKENILQVYKKYKEQNKEIY